MSFFTENNFFRCLNTSIYTYGKIFIFNQIIVVVRRPYSIVIGLIVTTLRQINGGRAVHYRSLEIALV